MEVDLGVDSTGVNVDNEGGSEDPLGNGYVKDVAPTLDSETEGDDMDRSCDANIVNVMEVEQEAITVEER